MPDISMCANKNCPLREKCFRFMATPSGRQYYGDFVPTIKEDGSSECNFFMKIPTK